MKLALHTTQITLAVEQNGFPAGTVVRRVHSWSQVSDAVPLGHVGPSLLSETYVHDGLTFSTPPGITGNFITMPFNYFYVEADGCLYYLDQANRTDTAEAISLVGHAAVTENNAAIPKALYRATRFELFDSL